MKKSLTAILWVYRQTLRLYPARVRSEYGEEMDQVFTQGCHEAAQVSSWAVVRLALVELWDLPANLLKEHWDNQRSPYMNTQSAISLPRAIGRGSLWFGLCFLLVYSLFSLADSLVNGGQTLRSSNLVWNTTWLNPAAIACALGALYMGTEKGIQRRKVWISAACCLAGYWVFSAIGHPMMNPPRQLQNIWTSIVAPFMYMALAGVIFGGLIGWLQHGRKQIGIYALTGAGGFMLGWLIDRLLSDAIVTLMSPTIWLSDIVVGSLPYFVYFLVPVFIRGLIIGLCFGLAALKKEEAHLQPA